MAGNLASCLCCGESVSNEARTCLRCGQPDPLGTAPWEREAMALAVAGRTTEAVKKVRKNTDLELRAAKELVASFRHS